MPTGGAGNSKKQRVVGKPFQPGQSGNPSGRPKSNLINLLAKAMGVKDPKTKRTNEQEIVARVIEMAKRGDREMINFIFDRLEGKVAQPLEHSGSFSLLQYVQESYGGEKK